MADATHQKPLGQETIARSHPLFAKNQYKCILLDVGCLFRHALKVISIIEGNCDGTDPKKPPTTKHRIFEELREWNQAFNNEQCSLNYLLAEYGGTALKHRIDPPYLMIADYCLRYSDNFSEFQAEQYQRLMADDALEKNIQIVPPTPDSNDNKDISWICSPEDKPTIESLPSDLHSKYGEMFTQSQNSVPTKFRSDSEDAKPDEADLQSLLRALQERQTSNPKNSTPNTLDMQWLLNSILEFQTSDPENYTPNTFDRQSLLRSIQECRSSIVKDSARARLSESLLKSIGENQPVIPRIPSWRNSIGNHFLKFTVGHLKALEPILNRCKAKVAAHKSQTAKRPTSDDESP